MGERPRSSIKKITKCSAIEAGSDRRGLPARPTVLCSKMADGASDIWELDVSDGKASHGRPRKVDVFFPAENVTRRWQSRSQRHSRQNEGGCLPSSRTALRT